MLIAQPKVRIVSKEVTLATGDIVRAYFAVILTEGVQEVRFLGTKPVETTEAAETPCAAPLCIAAPKTATLYETFIPAIFEAVSPFYTLDFLTSQLARAPSVR